MTEKERIAGTEGSRGKFRREEGQTKGHATRSNNPIRNEKKKGGLKGKQQERPEET